MTELIGQLTERKKTLTLRIEDLKSSLKYEMHARERHSFSPHYRGSGNFRASPDMYDRYEILNSQLIDTKAQLQYVEIEILRLVEKEKNKKIKLLILLT